MAGKSMISKPNHSEYGRLQPIRSLIFIFKFCGLWLEKQRFSALYLFYSGLFQCFFIFGFCGSQLLSFLNFSHMDQITVIVFECIAGMSTCVEVINLAIYFPYMLNCINIIKSFKCLNNIEVQLHQTEWAFFAKIIKFNIACCSLACLFSLSAPFFTDERILPFPAFLPLNWEHDTLHYWIAYFYQFSAILFLSHIFVLMECLHIFLLITIGVHLDILGQRLRNLGNDDDSEHQSLEKLLQIIHLFEENGRMIDTVETSFNIPFFYKFISSAFILCGSAFKLITMNISEDLFSVAFYASFSLTVLNEIFLPCYFGNELTLKRQRIAFSLYSSKWFEMSSVYQKYMIIFLEGLKRDRILRSGVIFTLSLNSFLTVINRSYSLFAVLRTVIN